MQVYLVANLWLTLHASHRHQQPVEPGERAVAVGIGTLLPSYQLLSLLRVAVATESELEEILSGSWSGSD